MNSTIKAYEAYSCAFGQLLRSIYLVSLFLFSSLCLSLSFSVSFITRSLDYFVYLSSYLSIHLSLSLFFVSFSFIKAFLTQTFLLCCLPMNGRMFVCHPHRANNMERACCFEIFIKLIPAVQVKVKLRQLLYTL